MSKENNNKSSPIAVIGIACLFPKADNLQQYWNNIREGVDAITDIPDSHWKVADYYDENRQTPDMTYARRGGFINAVDFDTLKYRIAPNNIEATDTTQLLGMVVAEQALLDAGYATGKESGDGREFDRDRTSVIMGVTSTLELVIPLGARLGHPIWRRALSDAGVADDIIDEVVQRISDSYVSWQENSFPGLLGNVVAGRIANHFDLGGTNCVVDAACASSLAAVNMAAMELNSGRCNMAVTGGMDTFNDIFMYMCFSKTPALSPKGDSRPFSADGDGTVLGEGLGVVILKRLEDAKRDGDKIYSIIKGIGSSSDGRGNSIYNPSVNGQMKALTSAYAQAGVSPDSIELIEAHGTGTAVGDSVEVQALQEVYGQGDKKPWCAIGSVKSMIGHTKAAAGIAGMIKIIMALKQKVLPPSVKVEEPLELLVSDQTPIYLNTIKRPWISWDAHPRRAAVSAFGFGGSNFHCVLEESESSQAQVDWDGRVLLFALSADEKSGLIEQLELIKLQQDWAKQRAVAARSCLDFDAGKAHRLVLVIEKGLTDINLLCQQAEDILSNEDHEDCWQLSNTVSYASAPDNHKTGLLFPGQGAQYIGMLRDLACQFPQFNQVLGMATDIAQGGNTGEPRLSDLIYPIPALSDHQQQAQENALQDTQNAQPAIGAVSLAGFRLLQDFGVTADVHAGHSYGELVALCGAGIFDETALHRLSFLRGFLMARDGSEGGSMLAVFASLETVEKMIADAEIDLTIANHNAPEQIVLSGAVDQIEKAVETCKEQKVRCRQLAVADAFHSDFVADAGQPFAKALEDIEFHPSNITVLSNTTGDAYPQPSSADEQKECKKLLAEQLARPVKFVDQIEKMYDLGVRTFIEVGPGKRLSGLVKSILNDRKHQCLALDASSGKRHGQLDLAVVLANLAVLGKADISRWDEGYLDTQEAKTAEMQQKKSDATITLTGANYVAPGEKRPPVVASAQSSETRTTLAGGQDALDKIYEKIIALQKMQETTALLHEQYLQGQEQAQQSIAALLRQQSPELFTAAPSPAPADPVSMPTPTPVPVPAEPEHTGTADIPATELSGRLAAATLLSVVAEKTGYQQDILDLDMNLESDLGIDSIKRVEILAALQERLPQASQADPEQLGELQTLRQVLNFLSSGDNIPIDKISVADKEQPADILLKIVSEKTGYPTDMLDLGMNLESDLGIDSIKRVEILAALQERLPRVSQVNPEQLGELQTLGQILDHLSDLSSVAEAGSVEPAPGSVEPAPGSVEPAPGSAEPVPGSAEPVPGSAEPAPSAPATRTMATESAPADPAPETMERAVSRQILSAVPLEELAKKIQLTKNAKIWITDGQAKLAKAIRRSLKKQKLDVEIVSLDQIPDETLAGLIILAPGKADDNFIRSSLTLIQRASVSLRSWGKTTASVLISITSMGGKFGLEDASAINPVEAGLTGLIKTAAKEWPEIFFKTIDIQKDIVDLADDIANECLLAGPLEVGLIKTGGSAVRRFTLDLQPAPINTENKAPALSGKDVIVVTGGAHGVTAEVANTLAKTYRASMLLLGRSKEPEPEPEWSRGLTEEADLKNAIIKQQESKGISTHAIKPRLVENIYRKIISERGVRSSIERITGSGVKVMYQSIDVRNRDDVIAAVNKARKELGPITGIIHGAGVLADKLIEDKKEEQFSKVYSTKVDGARNLLAATKDDKLKLIIMFSSSSARFGRAGQCDYAAANEVLNKIAQLEAALRGDCRVISPNWGPWDGGMVTAALKKIFRSEGIDLIPLADGAAHLMEEIAHQSPVEILITGRRIGEPEKTDPSMHTSLTLSLDVANYHFLASHVIKGKAVLPVAMIIEWLAHAALHGNPGMNYHGFRDLQILKGLVLEDGQKPKINILSGPIDIKTGIVAVELGSEDALHARAGIILGTEKLPPEKAQNKAVEGEYTQAVDQIYSSKKLFHGDILQGIQSVDACGANGVVAQVKSAVSPELWMKEPLRSSWLTDPLTVDSGFQLMILWCLDQLGAPALPSSIADCRQFHRHFPKQSCNININITKQTKHSCVAAIEFINKDGQLVARMEGCEFIIDESLDEAFKDNVLPGDTAAKS